MITIADRGHATALNSALRSASHSSLINRLTRRAGQLWCGLHGHDQMLEYGPSRVFLRCATCDHESPGWKIGARRFRVTQPADARRRSIPLLRVPFRRVA